MTQMFFDGEVIGDVIQYHYTKTMKTQHNRPRTREGLDLERTFEGMCKGFKFTLTKDEVPSRFYGLK
jgi:uncharacterized membrane protein